MSLETRVFKNTYLVFHPAIAALGYGLCNALQCVPIWMLGVGVENPLGPHTQWDAVDALLAVLISASHKLTGVQVCAVMQDVCPQLAQTNRHVLSLSNLLEPTLPHFLQRLATVLSGEDNEFLVCGDEM